MTVTRWAISLDKLLAKEIKRSAAGEPISAWIVDAARSKLRREGWARLIEEYEAEHGVITAAEMAAVDERHRLLSKKKVTKRKRRR